MAESSTATRNERLAGLMLIAAAAIALVAANSGAAPLYHSILDFRFGPPLPRIGVPSVHEWVADGLMAIFFMLVGLEVKREWYLGELSSRSERKLPFLAAAAGMAVPALVYLAVTGLQPELLRGWAIPAATDIAFAIGVLALLGSRAPPSIKLLLVTIAIVDDIGAVIIIALVYTGDLSVIAVGLALAILVLMWGLNLFKVHRLWPYLALSGALWLAVLASGVHATIAGVAAALMIPLGRKAPHSPLRHLERTIHPWVMFGVMPLFGLTAAGASLAGGPAMLLHPLPLAIAAGLFIGKQVGVFGSIWLAVRTGLANKPRDASWRQIYGAALLCGIGFTMSLFIGELAFPQSEVATDAAKIGTLVGSALSAVAAWFVLSTPTAVDADGSVAEVSGLFASDEVSDHRPEH
ncbi:MAG TPA: Na+/H+ antiporter NhaA [Sphingomicrobium sp.]|jgi:NhaA family Na+:H+ antiporter|nr:Na+/H+ antiporter NhaA [Sphingomicrobium sp.]